jgi:alkylation response protein AidB-like acyl-CoA dehydrogenase
MAHSIHTAVRDLAPLIAQHADEGERERRLARRVVDSLVNAGVFRLLVPQPWGGRGQPAGILRGGRDDLDRGWLHRLVRDD